MRVEQRAGKITNKIYLMKPRCRSLQIPKSISHIIPADFAGPATLAIRAV
jgi:hypothetical protein